MNWPYLRYLRQAAARLGFGGKLHFYTKLKCIYTGRGKNQDLTSSTTCDRFQPVADFASGSFTPFKQNSW